MRSFFSLISTLLIVSTSFSQSKFGDLTYKSIRDSIIIGYPNQNFTPVFKDTLVVKGVLKNEGEAFTHIGAYNNELSKFKCELFYSNREPEGISELYVVSNDSILFHEIGNTFHFKGNVVYVEGNNNDLFDKKRKYVYEDSGYKELKQPFYYVGIHGKLMKSIKIYQTQNFVKEVAILPNNYPIEIIAAYYKQDSPIVSSLLIKTKLGLVGWLPMKMEYSKGKLIKEFTLHSTFIQ